jgi:hypothetical protein
MDESRAVERIFPDREVEVTDDGEARVELVYEPPPPLATMTVRVDHAPAGAEPVVVSVSDRGSEHLRSDGEGGYTTRPGRVRRGDRVQLVAFTPDGELAGRVEAVAGESKVVVLHLARAGRVSIPPDSAGRVRLVEVRSTDGTRVLRVADRSLPSAGDHRMLPLPPGTWDVSVFADPSDPDDPIRVTVAAGEMVALR